VVNVAKMTSLERVATALSGGQPDMVPVATLAITRALREIGETPETAIDDPEKMARAKLTANERFGDDAIVVGIDGCFVEARSMGAKTSMRPHMPIVTDWPVKSWEDVDRLPTPRPEESPRMQTVLEEASIIFEKVGDHIAVAPIVSGVLTTALNLMGANRLYLAMVKEPKELKRLLDKVTEVCINYHTAFKGRAHAVVVLDPAATPELISPAQYLEFAVPYQKKMFDAIAGAGMIPINHICGDTTQIIQHMVEPLPQFPNPQAINIDFGSTRSTLDLGLVKRLVGDKTCIIGNVDPVGVMLQGTPEDVEAAARRCIEQAAEGGRYILTPGCDTNPDTPSENFRALVEAARKYGVYGS
jgi:uroporphyrinogen decarboxylase